MSKKCNGCEAPALVVCRCSPQTLHCHYHWKLHKKQPGKQHSKAYLTVGVHPKQGSSIRKHVDRLISQLHSDKTAVVTFTSQVIAAVEQRAATVLGELEEMVSTLQSLKELTHSNLVPSEDVRSRIEHSAINQTPPSHSLQLVLSNLNLEGCLTLQQRPGNSSPVRHSLPGSAFKPPNESMSQSQRFERTSSVDDQSYPNIRMSEVFRRPAERPPPPASKVTRSANGLVCQRNHRLQWDNLVPFQVFQSMQTIWIKCDVCSKRFSRSCWSCRSCSVHLCEECGNSLGCRAPKLTCNSGHELEWRADSQAYYKKEYGSGQSSCNFCGKMCSDSGNWHCRSCEFDSCEDCGKQRGYHVHRINLKAPDGEDFHLINDREILALLEMMPIAQCNTCGKRLKGPHYATHNKSFIVCKTCMDSQTGASPAHPVVSCPKKHLLRWMRPGPYNCDTCLREKNEVRYRCQPCDFDICSSCSQNFIRAVKNGLQQKCPSGHLLEWDATAGFKTSGWICAEDRRKYNRSGAFKCSSCRFYLCVGCVPKSG